MAHGRVRPEPPAPRVGPAKASGTRAALTEEPAQNGHEFFTCGELLSDSAPKLSATMQQPRISCSSPRDNSGRAGNSAEPGTAAAAAAAAARREESAGGAASTPVAVDAQRGRSGGCSVARGHRGRSGGSGGSWAAAAAAPGPPACGPPESPATGQQEPGSTTGRDMDGRGRERPVAAGRGHRAEPPAPRTGHRGRAARPRGREGNAHGPTTCCCRRRRSCPGSRRPHPPATRRVRLRPGPDAPSRPPTPTRARPALAPRGCCSLWVTTEPPPLPGVQERCPAPIL